MAYDAFSPFGEDRADWRAGMIASTIANCHITRGAALKPSDFMLHPPRYPHTHPASGQAITQEEWERIQEENQIAAWQRLTGTPPTSPASPAPSPTSPAP